ncbi:DUF4034 domain-containing protein [Stenotrophomonas sp. 364]|uniref:DUF4034 domain-containing protein n=1 Tax=Stenotrophomonas sp. 364 TaxID=2691571 RepID=UPI001319AEF8|nr:DUF4034 domain-containing protein [Stenotrophomonas sp. 364]QHB72027.1 DUF4034 domain-containing protein [Stenotrophomonas sp. 364]
MAHSPHDALTLRRNARDALHQHRFDDVDRLLGEMEQQWLDGSTTRFGYGWLLATLLDPAQDLPTRLEQARQWCAHQPHSPHPWAVLGALWDRACGRIRSSETIETIRQVQWDAAGLARDHAMAAWLHTIARHPRPAFVLGRMLRMSCYLGEPRWLQQLQRGGRADLYNAQQHQDPDGFAAAVALLAPYGRPLEALPALPPLLAGRGEEAFEYAADYWLQQALAIRANDTDALETYLYYLYPRWGGSHAVMQDFIDGPEASRLMLPQRNRLRVIKERDWLYFHPDAEHAEDVAQHDQAYAALLDLHLDASTRAQVLCWWAMLDYHLGRDEPQENEVHWDPARMAHARDCLAEALALDPACVVDEGLTVLEACALFAHVEGADRLFAQALASVEDWTDSAHALAWLAAGRQSGLFGFSVDAALATQHLRGALAMAREDEVDLSTVAANLFCAVSAPAGLQMLLELGAAGDPRSMATLVDLYRGRVGGQDFPAFIDPAQESAWTERAIAAGDLVVIYNRAWQLGVAFEQTPDPALQQQSRALYRRCVDEAAPHDRVWRPAHKNLAVLLYQGEEDADKQEAVFDLLGPLWWRGDSATRAWAAGFLADVFHFGNGVPANAFLAKTWLERAAEADPDNDDVLRMRPLIDGQGKLFGASRAARQQARDREAVDLRSWQLTFGQHAVPDRHDVQPV